MYIYGCTVNLYACSHHSSLSTLVTTFPTLFFTLTTLLDNDNHTPWQSDNTHFSTN